MLFVLRHIDTGYYYKGPGEETADLRRAAQFNLWAVAPQAAAVNKPLPDGALGLEPTWQFVPVDECARMSEANKAFAERCVKAINACRAEMVRVSTDCAKMLAPKTSLPDPVEAEDDKEAAA